MEKTYDPRSIETEWYRRWLEAGLFHSDLDAGGEPYCIVIPPPNVTGILHMGHALNNTMQDILVRWRRMQGRNVVWMPGTDHAGIATQNVVERSLKKEEGKTRQELGREAFIRKVWEWREKYGSTIINQLKRLGASCDWERERFTMDSGLSDAVAEVFVRLYEKRLIYRGSYIINWCPRCQTALSDEESEHEPAQGKLYHIRYPLRGKTNGEEYVTVATTRPETMLGDTALAVNPGDARYGELEGAVAMLPVIGRELKIIKDEYVDPEFGTGIVKVTPAHDPNDFETGLRHSLKQINIMNEDGTMNDQAGPYSGMDRLECRKKLVAELKEQGLLEKAEDHSHSIGHCYRCRTVVEPRLSSQWFVKMKPLAAPAIEAVKNGSIEFVPRRWTKVYLEWMENIRDWCISRQIWWGHRIPVFYCGSCRHQWASRTHPESCPKCGSGEISQDEDVLDTWFSSWLWPFSTFGWPENTRELDFYYPTDTLVTAPEIIFFWVARMIMAGLEFMDEIPFSKVYIHGTVRSDDGRKMSKSLGNAIDPLAACDKYGADGVRFSLMMITAVGQDIFLSDRKFEIGRNFGTKLWNSARYISMQMEENAPETAPDFDAALLSRDDQHILARLQRLIRECNENLQAFRLNDVARGLYDFAWHQYCDWYLEYSKLVFYSGDEARKKQVLRLMNYVFSTLLRLLHPVMPFITEHLWHIMGYAKEDDSIMTADWPRPVDNKTLADWGITDQTVGYVEAKHDLIVAARALKADYNIPSSRKINYTIKPSSAENASLLREETESLEVLTNSGSVRIDADIESPRAMPSAVTPLGTVFMEIEGVVDRKAESERLSRQLAEMESHLERANTKLNNEDFLKKAPAEVVEKQRSRRDELMQKREKLDRQISVLSR
ncbi:MAG: valine--tRNA ligase [Kiritimatiellia bacterium]